MNKPNCWMTPDEIYEVNGNDCRLVAQICARLDRLIEVLEALSSQQRAQCGEECDCCVLTCVLKDGHHGPHVNIVHSWSKKIF